MSTAFDLLADLLAPAANADPEGTAANPANSAKSTQPCGLAADRGAANGLRKAANFCESQPWNEAQRLCLRYLDWIGPLDLRNLAAAAQLPPGEALAALRGLRELGHVARVGDCWRVTDRAIAAVGDR
jgi:hypothetical protein